MLRGVSGIVVIAALGASGQALAQTSAASATAAAAPSTVEAVTITAERRSSTIQKTPIAITAVSAATLDKTFATQVSDLNAVVPSLEITHTSGMEQLVTIRGVGSETPENSASTLPGVSVFNDGVYLANSMSLDQTLFDVDHIEVLRGPQGDLFGESSIGGAINIVSNQPKLHEMSGFGDVSFGDYNLFRARIEENIPLGDDFAIRASAQHYSHGGFATDTSPNLRGFKEDDAGDTSGKLAFLWKPTDHFSATLTGQWYLADTNGAEQNNINDPNSDPRKFNQDFAGQFNLATQLYHLNLNWDLPWAEIKSITAYQHFDHISREDSSRSSFAQLGSYDDVPHWTDVVSNYNQEIDILSQPGSPIEWIIGGFGENISDVTTIDEFEGTYNSCGGVNNTHTYPGTTPDVGPILDPGELNVPGNIATSPTCNLAYGNISTSTRQGLAGFGRVTFHPLANLTISAGARYNWDRYSNDSYNYSQYSVGTNSSGYAHATPTWRFVADYDITPENAVYASYTRGYKPGGVNGSPNGAVVVANRFLAETNDGFELGSKNYFLDHTLQFNADVFYYDHHNFQYIEQDPVPFDDGMANIPHVRDYGAEFEAHYRGLENKLHIDGTLALEKGEVVGKYLTIDSTVSNAIEGPSYSGGYAATTFPPGPCIYGAAYGYQYNNPVSFATGGNSAACWAQVEASEKNIQGKEPPAMPEVSGSIDASYDYETAAGTLTPWIQVVYRGHEWARIFNEPSLDSVPSYTVVNLNVAFVPVSQPRLKVSLAVTNIGDVAGINSQYTDPYGTAQTSRQYIAPRQVIGTIAYAW
jgi:iron complex outermembrane receptor protein